jgi:HAD superfamily hydrolase (TIGR01549 family)
VNLDLGAVLFDLDGTLIRHTRRLEDLCAEAFARFSARLEPVTSDRFWEVFWPKARDMWTMMVDGVLDGETAYLYSFVNTLRALNADPALARPLLVAWEEVVLAATRLPDDAEAVILRLREAGLRTGIVTNGYTAVQSRRVRKHGLDALVDFVLISEQAGAHKPNRAIFAKALELAGVGPAQAVFVGDSPTADIAGARDAEMHTVLLDTRSDWQEAGADAPGDSAARMPGTPCIQSLSELLPLLNLAPLPGQAVRPAAREGPS